MHGEASGSPEPVSPRRLGHLGSVYVTHPGLPDYTHTRAELLDAGTRRRFENERHTLATLDHPNIVRVFHYIEANATGYMVMDYVDGQIGRAHV